MDVLMRSSSARNLRMIMHLGYATRVMTWIAIHPSKPEYGSECNKMDDTRFCEGTMRYTSISCLFRVLSNMPMRRSRSLLLVAVINYLHIGCQT